MYFDDAVSDALYASASPYSSRPDRFPASNADDLFYNPALHVRTSFNGDHALGSFTVVISPELGLNHRRVSPHSLLHLDDFGGGSPSFALAS